MSNNATLVAQLMHVVVKVNEFDIVVVVDTSATHTFISSKVVHDYRLKMSKCSNYLKMVTTKLQAVDDIAYGVAVIVRCCTYKVNILVINLDDYDMILDVDFYMKAKLATMPHLDGVMVMQEKH